MAKAKRVRAKGKAREDSESVDGHKDQTEAINRVINMKKMPMTQLVWAEWQGNMLWNKEYLKGGKCVKVTLLYIFQVIVT